MDECMEGYLLKYERSISGYIIEEYGLFFFLVLEIVNMGFSSIVYLEGFYYVYVLCS